MPPEARCRRFRIDNPDPFIQSPDNLQSFNRYSYVWNNPLSYNDPSGFYTMSINRGAATQQEYNLYVEQIVSAFIAKADAVGTLTENSNVEVNVTSYDDDNGNCHMEVTIAIDGEESKPYEVPMSGGAALPQDLQDYGAGASTGTAPEQEKGKTQDGDGANANNSSLSNAAPQGGAVAQGGQQNSSPAASPTGSQNVAGNQNATNGANTTAANLAQGTRTLPDIRFNPATRTYTYNDPTTGPRNVTPFRDEISGFNWHTDRNLFNRAPNEMPRRGEDGRYVDNQGNVWTPDNAVSSAIFHGINNTTFRGTGDNLGCQITYNRQGELVDSGKHMGTFDYARAPSEDHTRLDVNPHYQNSNYTPNLTTRY